MLTLFYTLTQQISLFYSECLLDPFEFRHWQANAFLILQSGHPAAAHPDFLRDTILFLLLKYDALTTDTLRVLKSERVFFEQTQMLFAIPDRNQQNQNHPRACVPSL